MKCYNHRETDAIGICKNCNKGLCKDCVTEIENGLACTATCIDEVEQINALINKSKLSHATAAGSYNRSAYISGSMGVIFILWGIKTEGVTGFLTAMGVLFIIASVFSFIAAKKYKKM